MLGGTRAVDDDRNVDADDDNDDFFSAHNLLTTSQLRHSAAVHAPTHQHHGSRRLFRFVHSKLPKQTLHN